MSGYTVVNGVANGVDGHAPKLDFTVSSTAIAGQDCSPKLTMLADLPQCHQQSIDLHFQNPPQH